MTSKLQAGFLVVDGLVIGNFRRDIFEDMRRAGLTSADCTSCA